MTIYHRPLYTCVERSMIIPFHILVSRERVSTLHIKYHRNKMILISDVEASGLDFGSYQRGQLKPLSSLHIIFFVTLVPKNECKQQVGNLQWFNSMLVELFGSFCVSIVLRKIQIK